MEKNTPIEPTRETLGVVSTGEYTVSEEKKNIHKT